MLKIALLLLTVAVIHASVKVMPTSNNELHPSTIELEVTLPDSKQKVLISLTKTDALEDTTITVFDNGVSRTFSASQVRHTNHSNYRDIASKSVISLRYVNGTRRISGHVMEDGISYLLEPVGEAEHRVTKIEEKFNDIAKQISRNQQKMQSRKKRQSLNTATTTYVVEILLLLDNTVWNGFKTIFPDENTALTELYFYYTHILNGIDTVYRNIGTPSISIRCIGLTLAKTAADATWMPAGVSNAYNILEAMVIYSRGKTADHVMAFTRIAIKSKGNGGEDYPIGGRVIAIGGVCFDYKQSLVLDTGLQSWETAAHELAHNLGALHDDSNCDGNQRFLMSSSPSINSYRFSSCTIDYITKHINSLGATNCLTANQGTPLIALSAERGTRPTLDQVCKLTYPNSIGKVFETPELLSNPATMCYRIFCCNRHLKDPISSAHLKAPAGTACGSKKSCNWNGQCVDDWAAPPFVGWPASPVDSRPGYPADSRPGYPADSRPGYPADNRPGYPADNRPGYPADNRPGYPANNRPGYPADNRPGYPADNRPGYPADNRPGYPADNRPGYPVGDSCLDDTPDNPDSCSSYLTGITQYKERDKADRNSYWGRIANNLCNGARKDCCKTVKHICGF